MQTPEANDKKNQQDVADESCYKMKFHKLSRGSLADSHPCRSICSNKHSEDRLLQTSPDGHNVVEVCCTLSIQDGRHTELVVCSMFGAAAILVHGDYAHHSMSYVARMYVCIGLLSETNSRLQL